MTAASSCNSPAQLQKAPHYCPTTIIIIAKSSFESFSFGFGGGAFIAAAVAVDPANERGAQSCPFLLLRVYCFIQCFLRLRRSVSFCYCLRCSRVSGFAIIAKIFAANFINLL